MPSREERSPAVTLAVLAHVPRAWLPIGEARDGALDGCGLPRRSFGQRWGWLVRHGYVEVWPAAGVRGEAWVRRSRKRVETSGG